MSINNGCVLLARKIISSEIWSKPSDYLKIWVYILMRVNHRDNYGFQRGENFFNWASEISQLRGVSINTLNNCIKWLKSTEQITTQKTTRGVILKVNNYDKFQDIKSYKKKDEVQDEVQDNYITGTEQVHKGTITINNNEKNVKNDNNVNKEKIKKIDPYCSPEISFLKKIYEQEIKLPFTLSPLFYFFCNLSNFQTPDEALQGGLSHRRKVRLLVISSIPLFYRRVGLSKARARFCKVTVKTDAKAISCIGVKPKR